MGRVGATILMIVVTVVVVVVLFFLFLTVLVEQGFVDLEALTVYLGLELGNGDRVGRGCLEALGPSGVLPGQPVLR